MSTKDMDENVHGSLICNSPKLEPPQFGNIKFQYFHTMGYYLALKMKEMLAHSTTWMNFEDIMLSEINQKEKGKYCMFSLICGI